MENGKQFDHVSDDIEKDVWFYSKKFGLNRTNFRMIMSVQQVADAIHALNYSDATAEDLVEIILNNEELMPNKSYRRCVRHLERIINTES